WDSADVELEIKDDIGNKYAGKGNGGSSKVAEPHKSSWSATFQKLNENATKLIVTPHVNLRVHTPENHGGVEYVNGKEKKIEVPKKEVKSKDEFHISTEKSAEDELILMEDREELLKLINQLEPLDQKVFVMKYLLGMKTEEIGDKLGLTRAAIDNRVYRGKKKLQQNATNISFGGSVI
ncbi:MAG: sigma-70 family RNA polymerase sigma factor, partial [Rickettsia endosymbiont of Ixodes persulcatus]|nr:sigma-70 family RNA polymerase sigma factor [Rickettsia endosymbiont of Ixodes persulcatus]